MVHAVLTADLESVFGDPFDHANPVGHDAVLAADERSEPLVAGEQALDAWQANAEFVPAELGGRLTTVDALVRRLRPVFRRDAALGLGYGVTSLMAALNVWSGGTDAQRKQLADTLLDGQRVCVAYHELAHGNDVTANEMRAVRRGMSLVLDGRKEVINNAGRADHAVVFARTDERAGGRSHSLLLVDLSELPADRWRRLPRYRTMGLRGCHLGGLEFHGCPAPESALVGDVGAGADIALRSFQVSRCVTAGLGVGVLDAALFTVLRFARGRRLYGRTVAQIPHARSTLAGAFTDLLIADSLSTVAARSIHLLPANGAVYAAATKYLVPLLLEQAMDELAVILGARFYLREGDQAIFGKHFRDLPALSIGHAGGVSCQLTMLPQLPQLARSLDRAAQAPTALFDDSAELPKLALDALRLRSGPTDPVLAGLPDLLTALRRADRTEDTAALAAELLAELAELRYDIAATTPHDLGVLAPPAALALTERYATLLAAAACLGTWRHRRRSGDTAWIRLALHRLLARSRPGVLVQPAELDEALFTELTERAAHGQDFCLDAGRVHRQLVD
jgi:alkylation response protein AidB-like acyl-CoA dehydrogenase